MTTMRRGTTEENCRIIQALRVPGLPVLDLGCGDAQCTYRMEDVTLVDLISRPTNPPGVILEDIRSFSSATHFGTTYLLDVIEHLHKDDGLMLLRDLADRTQRIVIFTPTGELWIEPDADHPYEPDHPYSHKSGWTPAEMRDLGFTTWEWPIFHKFPNGDIHGAFFAWKDSKDQPSAVWVAREAKV